MNKLERWFLRRVVAREVKQRPLHARNIEGLYGLVREACEKEFYEDNMVTIDVFLRERFERTQFMTPNAKSQATDAALSRQVACTDGLGRVAQKDGDASS